MTENFDNRDWAGLKERIAKWAADLGFQQIGISDIELHDAEARLQQWLQRRFHGDMHYMEKHGSKRSRPAELVPGTVRVISARMDYLADDPATATGLLDHPRKAYLSRYALGRDYHKVLRKRLARLARTIDSEVGNHGYRVFVDSAPVLEKPLAEKAGLGWIGKHTNLINRDAGSWFFLGELYTDLPLPTDAAATAHCGSCRACIDVCPTGAIVAPYELDARRCISYLTIEMKGSIPEVYRKLIGNPVYGCNDCQLYCPWNKFARQSNEADFAPRHDFASAELTALFRWDRDTFLARTEGSAIRRIGFEQWQRNIAVALGNADTSDDVLAALEEKRDCDSGLVREHVQWALAQHRQSVHAATPAFNDKDDGQA